MTFLPTDGSSSQALGLPSYFLSISRASGTAIPFIYKPTGRRNFWNEIKFDQLRCFKRLNDLVFFLINVFLKELHSKAAQFGARTRIWQKMPTLCTPKTTSPQLALETGGSHFLTVLLDSRYLRLQDYVVCLVPRVWWWAPVFLTSCLVVPSCKTSGGTSTVPVLPVLPLLTCRRCGGAIHSSIRSWILSFQKSSSVRGWLRFLVQPYLKTS